MEKKMRKFLTIVAVITTAAICGAWPKLVIAQGSYCSCLKDDPDAVYPDPCTKIITWQTIDDQNTLKVKTFETVIETYYCKNGKWIRASRDASWKIKTDGNVQTSTLRIAIPSGLASIASNGNRHQKFDDLGNETYFNQNEDTYYTFGTNDPTKGNALHKYESTGKMTTKNLEWDAKTTSECYFQFAKGVNTFYASDFKEKVKYLKIDDDGKVVDISGTDYARQLPFFTPHDTLLAQYTKFPSNNGTIYGFSLWIADPQNKNVAGKIPGPDGTLHDVAVDAAIAFCMGKESYPVHRNCVPGEFEWVWGLVWPSVPISPPLPLQ